ncbi:MAG: extracellular solute-binding protein [Pleurocapsa minor GSE-CHR-MK-17-07R]|jgi:raffinose/stachyose/melibiose transport system substrate-binding protein|nr:extracellular solute-binding protein [Pleurocapsa minor GSE-CHR-MK 17-07R]
MNARRFLLIAVIIGTLGLFSVGVVAAQDPVTIDWWTIYTTPPELTALSETLAQEFMDDNPGVTIEITHLENEAFKERLATVMQSGDPPDIFQSWGGGVMWNYAEAGLLRDITADLTADDSAWQNSFSTQAALNLYSYEGAYYGIPMNFGAVGFWYNTRLFAEAGIEGTPETWDEFLADVQLLKDAGITPIALGGRDKWPGHFWWVYLAIREGGQAAFESAYTREGSFADPAFVAAGERLMELTTLQPFQTDFMAMGYGQEAGLVGNGEAAMELMGQWAPGVQQGNSTSGEGLPPGELGWFPFPTVEGGAGNPTDVLGGGDGFAVGVNAPDAAVDFLRFLTSPEVQTRFVELNTGFIPTVTDAEGAVTDPLLQAVTAARNEAGYYQLYYDQFLPPAVAQAVLDGVEGLFVGTLAPADAAQAIEDVASFELE